MLELRFTLSSSEPDDLGLFWLFTHELYDFEPGILKLKHLLFFFYLFLFLFSLYLNIILYVRKYTRY